MIKSIVPGIVSIIGIYLLWGCPDIVEDPNPPAAPIWIEKSQPEAFIEKGIDAHNTRDNKIILMWRPNTENDLAGYRIYRLTDLPDNQYEMIKEILTFETFETDTLFIDDGVVKYVPVYYYLTAMDLAENESLPSDTINYMLINEPALISPVNEVVSEYFTFSWLDRAANYYYSSEYVIRLDDFSDPSNIVSVWVCRFTNVWFGNENTVPNEINFFYPDDPWPSNILYCGSTVDSLIAGTYRWKIKAISEVDNHTNLDESSGESEWGFFSVE